MVAPNDCSLCHTHRQLEQHGAAGGPHAEPGQPGLQRLSHARRPRNYTTLAANSVLHTGISTRLRTVPRRHRGADLVQQFHAEGCGARAPAHPVPVRHRLQLLPYVDHLRGRRLRADEHDAGHARRSSRPPAIPVTRRACPSTWARRVPRCRAGRPITPSGQMVAPNDCSLCHTTANWNSTVMPAGHMPNPANQACSVCHTAAPANYTTLAANAVLHTGITSGLRSVPWRYDRRSPGTTTTRRRMRCSRLRIFRILAGTSCGSCHSSSTYAVGGFGPMNMTQATHAFVGTTCTTCHEKGLTFYMGAANPALQGRPADHTSGQMVAPNNCSICHTTANWNSTTLPAGHMPNPGNQACTVCHTARRPTMTTLAANAVLHTGITSGCITCHGAPNAAAPVFYLNYTPKDAVLSPVHIPTSTTACEGCHAVSFTHVQRHDDEFVQAHLDVVGNRQDLRSVPRPIDLEILRRQQPDHAAERAPRRSGLQRLPQSQQLGRRRSEESGGESGRGGQQHGRHRGERARRRGGERNRRRAIGCASRRGCAVRSAVRVRAGLSHAGVTGNCASCHNGVLAPGKGPDAHREQQRLPELPHDPRVVAGALRSPRCHGELRELPQRRACLRQADPARPDDRGLRRLSWHDRLDGGELQSPRGHGAVQQLPQRHQCHRQADSAPEHDARLRHVPQHRELERRRPAREAAALPGVRVHPVADAGVPTPGVPTRGRLPPGGSNK